MRPPLVVGATVWISVDDPRPDVVRAVVLDVERRNADQALVGTLDGKRAIRHIEEIHTSEVEALRARCDQERYWAARYRRASQVCLANEAAFLQRIEALERALPPARLLRR